MKKLFFMAAMMAATISASATDVWEGNHPVTWETTLNIGAEKFNDIKVGDKLVVDFKDATGEVIELHSNGTMLPGTRFEHHIFSDQSNMEVFVTPGMQATLKANGLEICGKDFTATKVWFGDGKDNIGANTVWSGYFWMDSWSTLEITKNCFDGINWGDYKAIRFYSEAGRTNYVINILTKWDDGFKLGDQTTMTMTNDYAELSLEGIDMAAKLAEVDRLMIQCNKEEGEPFNFTAVELVPKEATGVRSLSAKTVADQPTYDLSGKRVMGSAKGIYIVGGKKIMK